MIHASWLLVVLTVLAVARLTRLITADKIGEPFRRAVIGRRLNNHPARDESDWAVYLVHCRWCTSIWIAFPVAAAVYAWHNSCWVQVPLLALAASHAAVLLAGAEDA